LKVETENNLHEQESLNLGVNPFNAQNQCLAIPLNHTDNVVLS